MCFQASTEVDGSAFAVIVGGDRRTAHFAGTQIPALCQDFCISCRCDRRDLAVAFHNRAGAVLPQRRMVLFDAVIALRLASQWRAFHFYAQHILQCAAILP